MKVTEEEVQGRWVDLSDRAVFRLTGPDRVRFLNGQVTNDVTKVSQQETVPACLCNAKGKVEALVWISKDDDSLLIDGELSQREEIFARIDRYLIADDCELTDETGKLRLVHHFDESVGGASSRRASLAGWDRWYSPSAFSEEHWQSANEIGSAEWEGIQLRSAIPLAGYEITGSEFPAELRIDSWAVSFQKGCYLGQEVISRIKSVGKVKRQLSLIFADCAFSQESTVRNSELGDGVTTRGSKVICDRKNAALAWFATREALLESLEFQQVEIIQEV